MALYSSFLVALLAPASSIACQFGIGAAVSEIEISSQAGVGSCAVQLLQKSAQRVSVSAEQHILSSHKSDAAQNQEPDPLCGSEGALDFSKATVTHSNLGGAGPDDGDETLVFSNVATIDAGQVDLTIAALSPYVPRNVANNRVQEGIFGMINLKVNNSVSLSFRFVNAQTQAPVIMGPFYFTIFDIDQGMAHESRERFLVRGFESYVLHNDSQLTVKKVGADAASFESILRGGKLDNPRTMFDLSTRQKKRTVALAFPAVSEFSVDFEESGYARAQGRNLIFGGRSSLTCPRQATCAEYPCPSGYSLRTMAEFLVCARDQCRPDDRDICCYFGRKKGQ